MLFIFCFGQPKVEAILAEIVIVKNDIAFGKKFSIVQNVFNKNKALPGGVLLCCLSAFKMFHLGVLLCYNCFTLSLHFGPCHLSEFTLPWAGPLKKTVCSHLKHAMQLLLQKNIIICKLNFLVGRLLNNTCILNFAQFFQIQFCPCYAGKCKIIKVECS